MLKSLFAGGHAPEHGAGKAHAASSPGVPGAEPVTVPVIKRDLLKYQLGRLPLERLLVDLYELREVLPNDVEKNVASMLSKHKELVNLLDLLMHGMREPNAPKGCAEREAYRVPWVVSVLIKDGDAAFRSGIALDAVLLKKYVEFFSESRAEQCDEVIASLVTRTLFSVLKEHPEKVCSTLCPMLNDAERANLSESENAFAATLSKYIHVYFVYRLLPKMVRVRSRTSRKRYAFEAPSKRGVVHLFHCDILGQLNQQFRHALVALYGKAILTEVELDAQTVPPRALLLDEQNNLRSNVLDSEATCREVNRLENAVKAVTEIEIRVLLTPPPPSNEPSSLPLQQAYKRAIAGLNILTNPTPFLDMLDLAMRTVRWHSPGAPSPLAAVLSCLTSVYQLFDDPTDLDVLVADASLYKHDRGPLESALAQRAQQLVDLLNNDLGSNSAKSDNEPALGLIRSVLAELLEMLMRKGGPELSDALIRADLPSRLMSLVFEFPYHSLLHGIVTRSLESSLAECAQSSQACAIARCYLAPGKNLAGDLLEMIQDLNNPEQGLAAALAPLRQALGKSDGDQKMAHRREVKRTPRGSPSIAPAYGHARRFATAVKRAVENEDSRRALGDVVNAEMESKLRCAVDLLSRDEVDEVCGGELTRVKTNVRRKKKLEMVHTQLEDDGDHLYYMQILAEMRKQKDNPRFTLFEFLGLGEEAARENGNNMVSDLAGAAPLSEEQKSLDGYARLVDKGNEAHGKHSDEGRLERHDDKVSLSEIADRLLRSGAQPNGAGGGHQRRGRAGLPTSISLDAENNIIGLLPIGGRHSRNASKET